MEIPLQSFYSMQRDQRSIGRHPHKDFKQTELCYGPIQTHLEAFLASWSKPK